jgi:hypothetical protein
MPASRPERNGAIAGIVFVALIVGAILVSSGAPGEEDPPAEFVRYWSDDGNQTEAYVSALLGALGGIAFLWFLGALRTRLFAIESTPGHLTALVFAGGIVGVALQETSTAVGLAYPSAVDFFDEFRGDGQLAMALLALSFWLGNVAAVGGTVMAGAVTAAAFRLRVFPRWMAWVSAVVAVGQLLSLFLFFTGLLFLPWVLLLAILMLRPAREERAPAAPATAA